MQISGGYVSAVTGWLGACMSEIDPQSRINSPPRSPCRAIVVSLSLAKSWRQGWIDQVVLFGDLICSSYTLARYATVSLSVDDEVA